jgi:formylglycine-generating enzyme required for sulfatase activity
MAVKIAGRYRGRVIAWARRSLVPGTVLALATIGPLAPGLAGGPTIARADGIMLVEAGAFWMGRDSGAPDEAPRHRVYVRDFWLERDKVTNRELAEFLDARGLRSPEGVRYVDPDDPDVRIHRRHARLIADAGFEARLLPLAGPTAADRGRVGEGRHRADRGAGPARQPPGMDGLRLPALPVPRRRRARAGRARRGPGGPRREPRRPRGRTPRDDPTALLV